MRIYNSRNYKELFVLPKQPKAKRIYNSRNYKELFVSENDNVFYISTTVEIIRNYSSLKMVLVLFSSTTVEIIRNYSSYKLTAQQQGIYNSRNYKELFVTARMIMCSTYLQQ